MLCTRSSQCLLAVRSVAANGSSSSAAAFSTSVANNKQYKLVVVGGGAGGCATAAKYASKFGKGQVAVIEPSKMHYYQPMWTMVGGGLKEFSESGKPMKSVLPANADWLKEKAVTFDPDNNKLTTESGKELSYEFLVVAMGLQLNYNLIKGLPEAFETPGVGSNFSPLYVEKTQKALADFKEGNAIFTFPNTPVKCAGAPQKIMYLSDAVLRKKNKRNTANVMLNSSLGVLFGVKKYADALWKVVENRDIKVNLRQNLIEVKPDSREAIFQNLDKPEETFTYPYEMLHVTPPMSTPDALRNCKPLTDANGYLEVDKHTLQHVRYPNIFGVGDCTSCPTSKTAAAVAGQMEIIRRNLGAAMKGKSLPAVYDGYTSCPLVTSLSTCILAEFDYDGQPMETFPIDQSKERYTMFYMKKDVMPQLYWRMLLNGYWEGPKIPRKMMHLGMSK